MQLCEVCLRVLCACMRQQRQQLSLAFSLDYTQYTYIKTPSHHLNQPPSVTKQPRAHLYSIFQEFEPSAKLDLNDTLRLASIW